MHKYIFDTSVLIDSYKKYYRFQNFPTFWQKFLFYVKNNECCFIDKVCEEVKFMKDTELYQWIKDNNLKIMNTDNDIIINEYKNVFNKIVSISAYTQDSISKWENQYVADPWLIAVAINYNYIIVSSELPANPNSQHK